MIEPKRYNWPDIRKWADEFRKKYVEPEYLIPLDVEDIIEFDLKISIWPLNFLTQKIDIESFLSKDLKTIFIDNDLYTSDRQENRRRFTLAHEIGHYILHQKEIKESKYRTEKEWIKFREEITEENLFWFEQQAYEFAGRLLVPKPILMDKIEKLTSKIEEYKKAYDNDEDSLLIQAISRIICDDFGVSSEVVSKRIKIEKIMEELDL